MSSTLEKIIESGKMPVLFIGSGISKRYLYKYPDWSELLENSFRYIDRDSFLYQKYLDELKRKSLSPFEINACLGSYAEEEFNRAFFDRKIRVPAGNRKNPEWAKRGISPYKMYLSTIFKKVKLNRDPVLQNELEKFRGLKNKTTAVITTNYDLFLETEVFNSDYSVFVNQSDLFSADSYNIAEIYKIHGSATDAESIVITKRDYDNFEASRKLIIAKMLTLFAEAPLIFLGYSFTDEDIQKIISDFISCLSPAQISTIDEHFLFVSYEKGQQELVETNTNVVAPNGTYIPLTEIKTDNFCLLFDMLNKIMPGISPLRIRQTRKVVRRIVDQSITSSSAESIIVGLDRLDDMDFSSKPLAIAVGYRESILNKYGYGMLADDLIIEDILYDNKNFSAKEMCFERFKSLPTTRLLPVFKYVSAANQEGVDISACEKLIACMNAHDSYEKLVPNSVSKTLKNVPVVSCLAEIVSEMDNVENVHKKSGILLKNIRAFDTDHIREWLCQMYSTDKEGAMSSTNFKRCVMYLDLVENHLCDK